MLRDRRAAVSVLAAISLTLLFAIAAIVIDIGSLYFQRRVLQSTTDAAALAAVQNPGTAESVANSVFTQNGYSGETLTITTGTYTANESVDADNRFVASNANINAVRVQANIDTQRYFAGIFGLSRFIPLTTEAIATRLPTASFGAGTRLAELNGGLLNSVLGSLWGSNLSLSLVDYQSLVTTNVDALPFLNQLATDIGVTGSYDQLAAANVTVGQIINALTEVSAAGAFSGDTTTAIAALHSLQTQVNNNTPMVLSDLIDLTPLSGRSIGGIDTDGSGGIQLNIMSLLSASARDAASNGTTNLGTAISIPVANSSVSVHMAAGSKFAQVADAEVGTAIHTSEIRIALVVTVTNLNLGLLTTTIQVPIYAEIAPGQAQLIAMPCVSGGTLAQIQATSGVTTLGFGTVSDSALSNFSNPLTPNAAVLANISLLGIPVQLNVAGTTGVNGYGPDTLSFTQADIDAGTIQSPGNANNSVFSTLGGNATLSTKILGNAGLQAGLLNSELATLLSTLKPVVSNISAQLNGPVNSILTAMGVQLGTIDVRVFDTSCRTPTLVE
jgi:uncharacterized membrane protein